MGIINRGGNVTIRGQAIGNAEPDPEIQAAIVDKATDGTATTNTGYRNMGGTLIVDGQLIED